MKNIFSYVIFLLVWSCVEGVQAQIPATVRTPSYYQKFFSQSPFTTAPPKVDVASAENSALSNWTLNGFAILGETKMVILQNKKNPAERLMLVSGEKNDKNIELLEIERGKTYTEDRVKIRIAGILEGWVEYDKSNISKVKPNVGALTPNPASNAKPAPQPPPRK